MNDISLDNVARDDAWIPSSCALCYGACSILAHKVDGVVVKIEGNPESAVGKGRLCGKGVSGIMSHYDPNRLTKPLRRTNPKKGIDEDPGWKEISWDEALDEIATVLKQVRAEDPRKLLVQRTTTQFAAANELESFAAAFGTPNISAAGGGLHCGNAAHRVSGITHSSWSIVPDFEYCNYAIAINAETGRKKGLRSGAMIWVENEKGRRVKGRVKLTEAIHPEALGIGACAGHWSSGMPVAKGKGIFFNELLELDREHASPINLNLDLCVRVKVTLAAVLHA